MKLIGGTVCAVICSAAIGASAGQTETKSQSKITIENGKTVTVTGCVSGVVKGESFMLTSAADKERERPSYMLLSSEDLSKEDLSKHVGHLVQVTGKASDRGDDATLKVDTKTKTKREHGNDTETHTKSEVAGNALGVPYLSVKSLKMIAARCQ